MDKSDEFRTQFYGYLNDNRKSFDGDKLNAELKDIPLEDFEKLHLLYHLHDNYNKIMNEKIYENEKEKKCMEYGENCVNKLIEAIGKYNEDSDAEFFVALKEFIHLYSYRIYNSESCRNIKLPKLPKFKETKQTIEKGTDNREHKLCYNNGRDLKLLDPENLDEYCNIIKGLNIFEKYKIFNEVGNADNNKYCADICYLEDNFPGLKKLCEKVSNNLINIASKENKDDRNEHCEHFYFWLSDYVWNLFGGNSDYIKNKTAALHFLNLIYDIIYRLNITECLFHYNPYESKEALNEKKHLYYYFRYYSTINDAIKSNNSEVQKEHYCKYINYIIDLYEKHLPNCCSCFSGIEKCSEYCKEYFKCDKVYYPGDLLFNLDCKYYEPVKSVEELFKRVTVSRNDLILISNELASPSVELEHDDPFYNIVLFFFSLLGIFFTFFIFYKFTPFGTSLHRNDLRKKNIRHDMREEYMERLSERRRKPNNFKSKSKRIQIAYQNN